ncbi:hypothetical protein NDU88_004874 [Pleurodeles waltl]|uniref:Uncharacterized protein n=1 Tax=Pleurodeles waltl TaxID=8319 RepID=A0AAV7PGY1_PLEWA|nr:hypothetical protein NDU88_004874 [Pleurodeles waltl]
MLPPGAAAAEPRVRPGSRKTRGPRKGSGRSQRSMLPPPEICGARARRGRAHRQRLPRVKCAHRTRPRRPHYLKSPTEAKFPWDRPN